MRAPSGGLPSRQLSLILVEKRCKARGRAAALVLLLCIRKRHLQKRTAFGAFNPHFKGLVLFPITSGCLCGT